MLASVLAAVPFASATMDALSAALSNVPFTNAIVGLTNNSDAYG
jgi:hypothetical protein